jgi:hypothetical protein
MRSSNYPEHHGDVLRDQKGVLAHEFPGLQQDKLEGCEEFAKRVKIKSCECDYDSTDFFADYLDLDSAIFGLARFVAELDASRPARHSAPHLSKLD